MQKNFDGPKQFVHTIYVQKIDDTTVRIQIINEFCGVSYAYRMTEIHVHGLKKKRTENIGNTGREKLIRRKPN